MARKKKTVVAPKHPLDEANEIVGDALDLFTHAANSLEYANEVIDNFVAQQEAEAARITAEVEQAKAQRTRNDGLYAKIVEFAV